MLRTGANRLPASGRAFLHPAITEASRSAGNFALDALKARGGEVIGTVFNIQGYATHDGPGIRTTVFLKGCPLSCPWCHNPEGRSADREISVNPEFCIGCGTCLAVCPTGAAVLTDGVAAIDPEECEAGGACVAACPAGARTLLGRSYTVSELLETVARDSVFYDVSGGGVTFSGGEPLHQSEFLISCLAGCAERDLHTAVDTSGLAAATVVQRVARLTDLFLYDLKLMDAARHRAITGADNRMILSNLRMLGEMGSNVWIRFPLIPGVNDDRANLEATASFVRSLPLNYPIQVLPYHRIGRHKYSRIGAEAPAGDVAEPGDDRSAAVAETFAALGIEARVGG